MAWWGKVIGGALGFMMGGPSARFLGSALGHQFDGGMARASAPDSNAHRLLFYSHIFCHGAYR